MLRQGSLSVAILALVAVGVVTSQDKSGPQGGQPGRRPTEGQKPGTVKPGEPEHALAELQFDVEGFLKDFDRDRDGFLSRDELPPRLQNHFDQMDTNKDGQVTPEERRAGRPMIIKTIEEKKTAG